MRPWRVLPGILLGSKRQATDAAVLARFDVTHVLSMTEGMELPSVASISSNTDSAAMLEEHEDGEFGAGGIGRAGLAAAAAGRTAGGVTRHSAPMSDNGHSSILSIGACISVLGRSRWESLIGGTVDGRDTDGARWRDPAVGGGGGETASEQDWADVLLRSADPVRHGFERRGVAWPESLVLLSPLLRSSVLFLASALGELGGLDRSSCSPLVQRCARDAQSVLIAAGCNSEFASPSASGAIDRKVSGGGTGWKKEGKCVLVHCKLGVSRSPTAIMVYLMTRRGYTLARAWDAIRQSRQETNPHPAYARQMELLDCCVHGTAVPSMHLRRFLLEESGSSERNARRPRRQRERRRRFAGADSPYGRYGGPGGDDSESIGGASSAAGSVEAGVHGASMAAVREGHSLAMESTAYFDSGSLVARRSAMRDQQRRGGGGPRGWGHRGGSSAGTGGGLDAGSGTGLRSGSRTGRHARGTNGKSAPDAVPTHWDRAARGRGRGSDFASTSTSHTAIARDSNGVQRSDQRSDRYCVEL